MNAKTESVNQQDFLFMRPAVWVMNRLKYSNKFFLIGILLLLPFFIATYLQISESRRQFEFNQNESHGMAYLRPIADFMEAVQYQGIYEAAVAAGDQRYKEKIESNARVAENAAAAVDEVNSKYGEAL